MSNNLRGHDNLAVALIANGLYWVRKVLGR